jgi:hypothetical protein
VPDTRRRLTIALRRCCACESVYGAKVWPWSGEPWVETHGYCPHCAPGVLRDAREPSSVPIGPAAEAA